MSSKKLVVHGGPAAVTADAQEQWKPNIEAEKKVVCELIERRELSCSGSGSPAEFEEDFRQYVGAEFCLSVSQGSNALHSAYFAVGVGPGDEVIVPTAGYIGTYVGVLHIGARPVFCEVDPETLLIDPADAERRITERTRAIVPIHFCGRVCDMDALMDIGRKHGVAIVEDAAHAHGSKWDGRRIGTIGDVTCFSLQGCVPGGKPVSGGEGGLATTNNRHYYERMLLYCHLHRGGVMAELTEPEHSKLDSEVLGLKWRAHPLALAIARVALQSLDYRIEKSRANHACLAKGLEDIPGIRPVKEYPKSWSNGGLYGGWRYIYQPDELGSLAVEKYSDALKAEGVPGIHVGIGHREHLRTIFREGYDMYGGGRGPLAGDFKPYKEGDFPITEQVHRRVVNLPGWIEPAPGLLDQIVEAFRKVADKYESLL